MDTGTALADPAEVAQWLDTVGLVRADVGRLTTAGMLSGLMAGPGKGWSVLPSGRVLGGVIARASQQ